jgi:DNA-binding NtrC family response regulator
VNVLIVDNEIVQVENLRIGLSSRGYHVLQALSGQDALDLIEKDSRIDLVLSDYAMPEMNGIELLQNIRWRHGNLPVILMSAYGQREEIVLDTLRNQCNGFIDKPFTLDRLQQEIERVKVHFVQNMAASLHKSHKGENPKRLVFPP